MKARNMMTHTRGSFNVEITNKKGANDDVRSKHDRKHTKKESLDGLQEGID